jgi:hypothetical protein
METFFDLVFFLSMGAIVSVGVLSLIMSIIGEKHFSKTTWNTTIQINKIVVWIVAPLIIMLVIILFVKNAL